MSVSIDVKIKRLTDKAMLVEHGGVDIWLPRSQIESPGPFALGVAMDLDITDWIAEQKDLTASAVERYIVEPSAAGTSWGVKDMQANPIHIICLCGSARDANIVCAALEMTKNKL